MRGTYNRFAGESVDRLAALSDGVFAIAMTLLVLDLHVPASEAIHSEHGLWNALGHLAPSLVTYVMSFLTLGIFWVGQGVQLEQFDRSNRDLTWLHLGFLLAVSLIPFSTALLAHFITYRLALLVYWLNILLLGIMLWVSRRYAEHAGLVKEEVTPDMAAAAERRIVIAQSLYAIGAALSIINTYVSITVIVLLQLNYAIAPRIRPLDQL